MHTLPQHKSSEYFETGVHLRNIGSPPAGYAPVPYAHQDDYYIFGLIKTCGNQRPRRMHRMQNVYQNMSAWCVLLFR